MRRAGDLGHPPFLLSCSPPLIFEGLPIIYGDGFHRIGNASSGEIEHCHFYTHKKRDGSRRRVLVNHC
jgi:hypothetical protein